MNKNIIYILIIIFFIKCDNSVSSKNIGLKTSDIAFISRKDGIERIILSNTEGTDKYKIPKEYNDPTIPTFSPFGDNIIYSACTENNSRSLVKFDLNNEKSTIITNNKGNDSDPVFSHNGSKIAFTSNRDNGDNLWNIFIYDINSSESKVLTNGTHHYTPKFSPDDTKILYSSYCNNKNEINMIDIETKSITNIAKHKYFFSYYQFSNDGSKIYYLDSSKNSLICYYISENVYDTICSNEIFKDIECINNFIVAEDDENLFISFRGKNYNYQIKNIKISSFKDSTLIKSDNRLFIEDCSIKKKFLIYQNNGDLFVLDLVNYTIQNITNTDYFEYGAKINDNN